MEIKIPRGDSNPKKPPTRLQKPAPASLQLDHAFAWEKKTCGGEGEGEEKERTSMPPPGGWRHPALPVVVVEPASLLPMFQFQCALVHNVQ